MFNEVDNTKVYWTGTTSGICLSTTDTNINWYKKTQFNYGFHRNVARQVSKGYNVTKIVFFQTLRPEKNTYKNNVSSLGLVQPLH